MRTSTMGKGRMTADIHRLLSKLMQRDIADPRLIDVSITRVEKAAGGHRLYIWVHRMGENDRNTCIERLNRLVPHFTHELRHALPRRRLPELQFRWDEAFDKGGEVLKLLADLEDRG